MDGDSFGGLASRGEGSTDLLVGDHGRRLRLYVRTGVGAPQKLSGLECLQDRVAHCGVKIPQPLHLRFGEVETRHLVVFGANELDPMSHRVLTRPAAFRRQTTDISNDLARQNVC